LRVTDVHESDDTVQAAGSTAKRTTPTVLSEAKIDDNDDFDNDLGGQRDKDSLIDNDIGDLNSWNTDQDHLDVVTQNRLMLGMQLQSQDQWKAEQKLGQDRMAAEWERMAAEWDERAPKCAECVEQSNAGPRPDIYMMVNPVRYCGGAQELDQHLDTLH